MGAPTDFLVGIEPHTNVSVLDFVMVAQIAHGLDNLRNAGFVVRAQQCGAVGHDQVFTHMLLQFGKLLHRRHDAVAQHDVLAVVIAYDAGLDVLSAGVGAGVVV